MAESKHIQFIEKIADIRLSNVVADGDRLCQVLINLLTNAIKFTPESGSVRVELSVLNDADSADTAYAKIQVTDTGDGISADFLPHVFDRFSQAQGSNAAKGLGLGAGDRQPYHRTP